MCRDCQVRVLSQDDAMVRGRWRKMITMVDEQEGCEWMNVSSGTGYPGRPGQKGGCDVSGEPVFSQSLLFLLLSVPYRHWFFTGWMPFPLPNQRCQRTKENSNTETNQVSFSFFFIFLVLVFGTVQ